MKQVSGGHLVLLVGICAIWGFNLIAIKAGVERMPPIFFSFLRFLVVSIAVLPFLRLRRGEMRWLLLAAVCSGGLQFALMFVGIAQSGSMSAVAIAGQLGVPFATLLSIAILGEQVRWRRWTGILLSFAGVMLIGFNPVVFDSLAGLSLVVLGAMSGSLGLVAIKRVHEIKPLELQAWFAWTSLPVLGLLSLVLERGQLASLESLDVLGAGAVLYTALAASLFGHTLFFAMVQRYTVTSVAPITVLAPLFSVMFAVLLLGESLDWRMVVGGAMTLGGVVIIALREQRLPAAAT
jgi:O-acetylserine/cysteine efflux transporter